MMRHNKFDKKYNEEKPSVNIFGRSCDFLCMLIPRRLWVPLVSAPKIRQRRIPTKPAPNPHNPTTP